MQWVTIAYKCPHETLRWRRRVKCEGHGKVHTGLNEKRLQWFGECPRFASIVSLGKEELEAIVTREG